MKIVLKCDDCPEKCDHLVHCRPRDHAIKMKARPIRTGFHFGMTK